MNVKASGREKTPPETVVNQQRETHLGEINKTLHISPRTELHMEQLSDISIFSPPAFLQPREHRKSYSQLFLTRRSHQEVTCLDFVAAMKGDDTTRLSKSSYAEELSSRTVGLLPVPLDQAHGPIGCTVYCETCMAEVHSVIEFSGIEGSSSLFVRLWATVVGCCGLPHWIEKFRVHKCPQCRTILGKVTSF